MTTKLTTDWHIAAKRAGGSTPASQIALCARLQEALEEQLGDEDHLICGDLFNDFTIPTNELIETYSIFATWLSSGLTGKKLALLRGNHDFSQRGTQASSFDLLATILKEQFPSQVTIATEVTEWKQFTLVPHLPNNDILNLEVSKLKDTCNRVIVFHANVDNFFAAETQHSLCLSMEQVEDLVSRGNLVIFGHEHQHRTLVGGRCVVLGNGAPSSVSDCLDSPHKYAAYVDGTDYRLESIWQAEGNFIDVDWRELERVTAHQFVRVSGRASAAEAAEVINLISKLRQSSDAFVITNAVQIEGKEALADAAEKSIESIRSFDVLSAVLSELDEKEAQIVREVMA